jgi:flavin-dependent dehydrogenase
MRDIVASVTHVRAIPIGFFACHKRKHRVFMRVFVFELTRAFMPNPSQFDVAIVGAGPAGLVTAIAAHQRGMRAVVVDCAEPPVDKACGEGIMPDGIAALAKLGIHLPASAGAPFEGIRFVDPAGEVRANFSTGFGYGFRRPVLHSILIEKALAAGIDVRWRQRVDGISSRSLVVNGEPIRSRYIIGADGITSKVRKLAELEDGRIFRRRYGFRRHYTIAPWSPYVEVHWGDRGQMYVTPIGAEAICVAFITADQHLHFDEALADFPQLYARLNNLVPATRLKGSLTLTRRLRNVYRDNVALVGDSSGSPDAITGDGLSMSFRHSVALADAMFTGDLAAYQASHRRISRLPIFMGELMLSMADHPSFRRRVFGVFNQYPGYFERMLAIHTGAQSPFKFGIGNTLSLGWRLLTL